MCIKNMLKYYKVKKIRNIIKKRAEKERLEMTEEEWNEKWNDEDIECRKMKYELNKALMKKIKKEKKEMEKEEKRREKIYGEKIKIEKLPFIPTKSKENELWSGENYDEESCLSSSKFYFDSKFKQKLDKKTLINCFKAIYWDFCTIDLIPFDLEMFSEIKNELKKIGVSKKRMNIGKKMIDFQIKKKIKKIKTKSASF